MYHERLTEKGLMALSQNVHQLRLLIRTRQGRKAVKVERVIKKKKERVLERDIQSVQVFIYKYFFFSGTFE
jgi:hypothetical protein